MLEGGLGGWGDVVRNIGDCTLGEAGAAKTAERAGRDFKRDCVGMVSRRAAGLDEGVEGLVGGTLNSCIRLVEFLCDLARDAAVGSSYRAAFESPATANPEPDAWV